MAHVGVVGHLPLAVLDDVVFKDLDGLVVDVVSGEELPFFVHSHVDSDVCV